MGLPALILCAQIKRPRVLQIRGQHDRLVAGLAGQLHTQVPRIQCDKGKLEVLGDDVLLRESIEALYSITEGAGIADLVPCQGSQAGCSVYVSSAWRTGRAKDETYCKER